ncbi:tetratricopeptide repeat protein [Thiothrix subterranea]|uniref:tetratricopeptide repeat protein n=1 Tax=Thiothrix subterranea TaxID=2735563 RepID=UPI00280AF918|nr:tetratricopeptide repeat protein [Thiothrix subterranea]
MKHKLFALLLMLTCSVQADETNLRNGIEAYRAEHYDTATQHFTAAVFAARDDTERARALHNLGNSYFQQGDYAAAAQVFRDALTYRPEHPATQQNLALAAEVQAELERRREAGQRAAADNASTGARRERNTNTLDWDQASTLTLGEGKDAPVNTPPPDLPLTSSNWSTKAWLDWQKPAKAIRKHGAKANNRSTMHALSCNSSTTIPLLYGNVCLKSKKATPHRKPNPTNYRGFYRGSRRFAVDNPTRRRTSLAARTHHSDCGSAIHRPLRHPRSQFAAH